MLLRDRAVWSVSGSGPRIFSRLMGPTVNTASSSAAPPQRIVIATRESRLALWQAEHVRDLLQRLYPSCSVELLGMTTRGDQILDRPLAKVGGKGLFVKELERHCSTVRPISPSIR